MDKLYRLYFRIQEARGQGMAEYALILAGVAVVAMAALTPLGSAIKSLLTSVTSDL